MGRDRNRELIAEYPWLDIGNKKLTLLDALPVGWYGLILDMCKEIKGELVKYDLVSKYQVVEAKEKSGTMYTVDYAKQYRRPVFAVPGSIYSVNSVGTNGLLRTGCAKAVTKAEDLFDLLHLKNTKQIPQAVRSTPAPMSETEKKVLACVSSESKGVEELIAESGLSASILSVTLMKLELSKQVIRLPGGRYILP